MLVWLVAQHSSAVQWTTVLLHRTVCVKWTLSVCRCVVWRLLSAVLLQGGAVKQYKGLECPLDGFELVLFSLSGTVRNPQPPRPWGIYNQLNSGCAHCMRSMLSLCENCRRNTGLTLRQGIECCQLQLGCGVCHCECSLANVVIMIS
jgi:hypothetical protein